MAPAKLHTLAQLAAELPSMDDALDELIARAHQVDSEAAAWAVDAGEAQAVRDAELDALRTQVTALEAELQALQAKETSTAKASSAQKSSGTTTTTSEVVGTGSHNTAATNVPASTTVAGTTPAQTSSSPQTPAPSSILQPVLNPILTLVNSLGL